MKYGWQQYGTHDVGNEIWMTAVWNPFSGDYSSDQSISELSNSFDAWPQAEPITHHHFVQLASLVAKERNRRQPSGEQHWAQHQSDVLAGPRNAFIYPTGPNTCGGTWLGEARSRYVHSPTNSYLCASYACLCDQVLVYPSHFDQKPSFEYHTSYITLSSVRYV